MTAVPQQPGAVTTPGLLGRRAIGLAVWTVIGTVLAVFVTGLVVGLVRGAAATAVVLPGWSSATVTPILQGWGLPAGAVVAYLLLLDCLACGVGLFAASLLLHRPWSGFRLYVALVLVLHTAAGGSAPLLLAAALPTLAAPAGVLLGLAWFGLFSLVLVFPDGRFVPRWTRWTVPAWVAVYLWFLTLDSRSPVGALPAIALLALLITGAGTQLYRYRRVADASTRQQTRWVLAALAARIGLLVVIAVVRLAGPDTSGTASGLGAELALTGASYLISALLALTIALSVLRHGLFDADVVIRRTVLFGGLTALVLVVYGIVVGLLGAFWQGAGPLIPVLATAAAAVALVPARTWLQQRVARLVYGDRAEPYRVVADLSDQLAATVRPEEMVQTVVDTIGPALDLQRVAIVLEGQPGPAAAYGAADSSGPSETFSIDHRNQRVGALVVWPRRGAQLSADDRRLLRSLAGQAGIAVAATQASAEVRAARELAVAAREEERRRLHRDLHDGLGPTLASIYQRVTLAAKLVETDPRASGRLLTETGHQVRETVADVRRLVYALRPPRLDDLGLVDALRMACEELSSPEATSIEVLSAVPAADLADLPAAVETTGYRIVLEAVTNTVRHAGADTCTVDIAVGATPDGEPVLELTVTDNGIGVPSSPPVGAGLRSLHERAAEVGGRLTIGRVAPHGTVVRATLPLTTGAASGVER